MDGPEVDAALANSYSSHLEVRAFAARTVRAYAFRVLSLLQFCDENDLMLAAVGRSGAI